MVKRASVAARRTDVLSSLGAVGRVREELRHYALNRFALDGLDNPIELPLPDEPFTHVWQEYADEATGRGVFETLRDRLVQLRFPIEAGIAERADYVASIRTGRLPPSATAGLRLKAPSGLRLALHQTPAGRIPVLTIGEREDFVTFVRALARRNEPVPVADSLGALMLSGFNNWDRIARLRHRFERGEAIIPGATDWRSTFAGIRERKALYQDRLLLLGPGPYSGVPAAKLGLKSASWERLSRAIRLEHESTHYLTRRLLGSMRNNLLDELIADYAGVVAAAGRFIGRWFLCFMGVDGSHDRKAVGRLHSYRGDPPLSDDAFHILRQLARRACHNLEAADRTLGAEDRSPAARCRMILVLASLGLEALAEDGADVRIRAQYDATSIVWTGRPIEQATAPARWDSPRPEPV